MQIISRAVSSASTWSGIEPSACPSRMRPAMKVLVGLELRRDARPHHRIDRRQLDCAADHDAAAAPLTALGVLDIRQQHVAHPLAAVRPPRRRGRGSAPGAP